MAGNSPRPAPSPLLPALAAAAVFLLFLLAWMVVAALAGALVELAVGGDAASTTMSARALIATLAVQQAGHLLLALLWAGAVSSRPGEALWGRPLAAWELLWIPALGALGLGPVSSSILHALSRWLPSLDLSQVLLLPDVLGQASPGLQLGLLLLTVLGAPLVEELVFRGVLWRVLSEALPVGAVWLLSSVLFCVYHGSLAYALGLLPISLYLGWVRWRSGSLWPAVGAHVANNTAATAAVILEAEDALVGPPLLLAGSLLSLGALGWLARGSRDRGATTG